MIKNDKKFIIIFIIIAIICFYYLFQTSYAKYRKKIDGTVQTRIASWLIKVNNENIENKDTLTNEITPVFDENQYVNNGVIAPGSTGYFELIINAEDVDVDFTYEITTTVDESTPLEDLVLTGYELNGTRHNYQEGSRTVTGDIQKNTGDTTLKVFFKWNDDSTNTMNNEDDTEYAIDENHEITKINVSIHFIQKKSA